MGFVELLEIQQIETSVDRVEMVMPILPKFLQPHENLHGSATIALLESAASAGAEARTNFEIERPFGIDVHVRHRKSGTHGSVRGIAEFDYEEGSKQFWNVRALDDKGDVMSEGVVVTKIVSLERLAEKERERAK